MEHSKKFEPSRPREALGTHEILDEAIKLARGQLSPDASSEQVTERARQLLVVAEQNLVLARLTPPPAPPQE